MNNNFNMSAEEMLYSMRGQFNNIKQPEIKYRFAKNLQDDLQESIKKQQKRNYSEYLMTTSKRMKLIHGIEEMVTEAREEMLRNSSANEKCKCKII